MAQEIPSRVMIAAPSQKIAAELRSVLPAGLLPVAYASSMTLAKQKLEREKIDILIIYAPLSDENGVQAAMDLARQQTIGILLCVKAEVYDQVSYAVGDSGVFVVSRPLSRKVISETVRILSAMQKRVAYLTLENARLRRSLEDLRMISRAKCLLISVRGMTEPEAHHYLEKLAMDSCITKREAAQDVIRRLEMLE